jgi:hypothetical protein
MGGAASRRKGLQFEREIAIRLRHIFPHAKRHLEFQQEEAQGFDLDNTGRYKIQCKKLKKYVSVNTIREIVYREGFGEVPILVTAGDSQEAMAVIPFQDLLWLIEVFERA